MAVALGSTCLMAVACSGGGDDDDSTPTPTATPTPTPTPDGPFASVLVKNWPHPGTVNFVRLIAGTNASASSVVCLASVAIADTATGQTTINTGGPFVLQVGTTYSAEVCADLGGGVGTCDTGAGNTNDHEYRTRGYTILSATDDIELVIDHNEQAGPDSFVDSTWVSGQDCPGD